MLRNHLTQRQMTQYKGNNIIYFVAVTLEIYLEVSPN